MKCRPICKGNVLVDVFCDEENECLRAEGESLAAKPWDFRVKLSRRSAKLLPVKGARVFPQSPILSSFCIRNVVEVMKY